MSTAIAAIEAAQDRTRTHATAFLKLVRTLAAGEKPPAPATFDEILRNADKSTNDLNRAVAICQERIQQAEELLRLTEKQERLSEVRAELLAEEEKYARAREQFEAVIGPLRFEVDTQLADCIRASNIPSELLRTCLDDDLKQRLARNRQKSAAMSAKRDQLVAQVSDMEAMAGQDPERAARLRADVKGLRSEAAKLLDRMEAAAREDEETKQLMLKP